MHGEIGHAVVAPAEVVEKGVVVRVLCGERVVNGHRALIQLATALLVAKRLSEITDSDEGDRQVGLALRACRVRSDEPLTDFERSGVMFCRLLRLAHRLGD